MGELTEKDWEWRKGLCPPPLSLVPAEQSAGGVLSGVRSLPVLTGDRSMCTLTGERSMLCALSLRVPTVKRSLCPLDALMETHLVSVSPEVERSPCALNGGDICALGWGEFFALLALTWEAGGQAVFYLFFDRLCWCPGRK